MIPTASSNPTSYPKMSHGGHLQEKVEEIKIRYNGRGAVPSNMLRNCHNSLRRNTSAYQRTAGLSKENPTNKPTNR